MVRTTKQPEVRRGEIIEAAKKLFFSKGVAKTSVSEIVKAVGVAQGTFYWYFESKQEVLNAIVEELCELGAEAIVQISKDPELNAFDKLMRVGDEIFRELIHGDSEVMKHYHRVENRQVHDRVVEGLTERTIPALAEIIRQGQEEEIFDVSDLERAAVFVFGATHAINDEHFFNKQQSGGAWRETLTEFVLRGLGYRGEEAHIKGTLERAKETAVKKLKEVKDEIKDV